jgi:hypothetical protein
MADGTQSESPGQDADPTATEDQADHAEATVAVATEDEHGDTAAAAVFVDDDEDGADVADGRRQARHERCRRRRR